MSETIECTIENNPDIENDCIIRIDHYCDYTVIEEIHYGKYRKVREYQMPWTATSFNDRKPREIYDNEKGCFVPEVKEGVYIEVWGTVVE